MSAGNLIDTHDDVHLARHCNPQQILRYVMS